ncbi:hydroxymethylbilane synthase [Halonotius aquaticus]|uniref:Hydroxymethylbilane synthase n=1 Tax=Halonotius aquaticus TaxID=2216978 RepID=A0A3A6PLD6_9EURY|nr:hydroxymethylbilane synthase [Halonotius aquaticus]RJX42197.1 hydroxymethylbilane synthase [Halonotius aquaticus]
MSSTTTVRLATRGSELARRQATTVKSTLDSRRREVTLTEVDTRGDQIRDELIHRLGKTGAFVRALDEKVLDGDLDAAVHSLKDMPTEMPADLVVAAVPERAPSGDVLVTPDGGDIDDLPEGAVVGTSSLRRKAQLLAARPDLDIVALRGNVDTRLEKLLAPSLQREHQARLEAVGKLDEIVGDAAAVVDSGDNAADDDNANDADNDDADYDRSPEEWFNDLTDLERDAMGRKVDTEMDAIVLAEAGLRRSDLLESVPTHRLPREQFVPAPGQGAIAVTAVDDDVIDQLREVVDHPRSRIETTAERTVLAELGGGCIAPIGVSAIVQGEYVHTRAQVLGPDGEETVEATRDLPITDHAAAAADFAADLRERGAAELIEAAETAATADTTGTREDNG